MFVFAFISSLVLLLFWPELGKRFFDSIENTVSRLARRKVAAILALGIAPILIRICLLPLIPVPTPLFHDEFSYLLAADTFASGRLTNPHHPMALFLDTIHVNQSPTYMSKYPPAQGMMLALGQILTGCPWVGVLISVGLMSAASLWMLQGWLPPTWALFGGVLLVLRIGIFSYWMNSYWGGAVPAIGGALVLGALPRLFKAHRAFHSLLMGIGAAILMNSRPFEGLALCLPVLCVLLYWLLSERSPSFAVTGPSVVIPCGVVLLIAVIFVGYYNRRVTGSAFLMPYALNEQNYWSTPTLLWQKARPPIHFSNAQFESFYNVWSRHLWQQSSGSIVRHSGEILIKFVYFFCWPELCLPLAGLVLILRDRKFSFLFVEIFISFLAVLAVAWFQPHYAAAVIAAFFTLLTQVMRRLKQWKFQGRPAGIAFARVVLIFSIVLSPFHPHSAAFQKLPSDNERTMVESQLNSINGNHLVIVRYSIYDHDPLREWVYNKADIDGAKIVWSREIPGQDMQVLLDYFHDRKVWLVEADSAHFNLAPYCGPRQ